MNDRLLTIRQAAEALGLKERTVRRWVFLRKITYIKVGRAVRIPLKEVDRIVSKGTVTRLAVNDFGATR